MPRALKWIIAVVVLWALAEASLYLLFGMGAPVLTVADADMEYRARPNQDTRVFGNHVHINSQSMRADELGARQPGETRVLFWGDSIIFGGNHIDQDELATEIVKRRLQQAWNAPVSVGNISAGGWGPGNIRAYAQRFGFSGADINIVVASSHDAFDVMNFDPLDPVMQPTARPLTPVTDLVMRFLLPRLLHHRPEETPLGDRSAIPDLKSFFELARKASPRLGLILHRDLEEAVQNQSESGGKQVVQACKDAGVTCIDSLPAYNKAVFGADGNFYRDGLHMKPRGQQILAALMQQMVGLLSCRAVPPDPATPAPGALISAGNPPACP